MSDIKNYVDLTVEAKSIYEAWNWGMLEAQMESEYDRGAFRELVNMYVNMVDNDASLITTIESQKEEINELEMEMVLTERVVTKKEEMLKDVENRMSEVIDSRDKALDEIESLKAITELAVKGLKNISNSFGSMSDCKIYTLSILDQIERLQND